MWQRSTTVAQVVSSHEVNKLWTVANISYQGLVVTPDHVLHGFILSLGKCVYKKNDYEWLWMTAVMFSSEDTVMFADSITNYLLG